MMQNASWLLILLFLIGVACGDDEKGGIWEGDATIRNGLDAEELALYSDITGRLLINAPGGPGKISLLSLKSVGQEISILENHQLTELKLPRLKSIGRFLSIGNNVKLKALDMDQLVSVGENLMISGNPKLPTCIIEAIVDQLVEYGGNVSATGTDNDASCP